MTAQLERVEQTIFAGDPRGIPGNCLQAAVATILGLRLEMVPHFVAIPGDSWWDFYVAFVRAHGREIQIADDDDEPVIATGMSPRGVSHAVVMHRGVVIDPHPSQSGLVDVQRMYRFACIEREAVTA